MVKFGEELESALFPLWKSYYIDYSKLKKALKAVCEHYPYMGLLAKHNVHIQNDPSRPFDLIICGVLWSYHDGHSGGGTGEDILNATMSALTFHQNERMFVRVTDGFLPSTLQTALSSRSDNSKLIMGAMLGSQSAVAATATAASSANRRASVVNANNKGGNPQFVPITLLSSAAEQQQQQQQGGHGGGGGGDILNQRNTDVIVANRRLSAGDANPVPKVGGLMSTKSSYQLKRLAEGSASAVGGGGGGSNSTNNDPDDDGWAPPITHPHFIDNASVPSPAIYEADPNRADDKDVHHASASGIYRLVVGVDSKTVMKLKMNAGADFDGDTVARKCLDPDTKGYIFDMIKAFKEATRQAAETKKSKAAAAVAASSSSAGGLEADLELVADRPSSADDKQSKDKKKKKKDDDGDDKDGEDSKSIYFRIVASAAAEKPALMTMRFYVRSHVPVVPGVDTNNQPTTTVGGYAYNNNALVPVRHLLQYNNPSIGHALYCYQHMVSNVLASVIRAEIDKVSNFYISQSHMVCSSALLCVDAVKMWKDLNIKEKSQLRIAFRQTYSTLDMIQQYCDLNCVAVGKILKKMDKNTHQNMLEAYRHAIEDPGGPLTFRMGRNSRIHKLQRLLAEHYARHAMDGGDYKKGLEALDAREFVSRKDQQPTLLSLTCLAGICATMAYFVITTMISMYRDTGYIFPPGTHADKFGAYLTLIPFVIVCMPFLFSINVMAWEHFGINFAFMFELDPIFHWSGAELMRDSFMYILVWLGCVYHFLLSNAREGGLCGNAGWVTTTTTTTTVIGGNQSKTAAAASAAAIVGETVSTLVHSVVTNAASPQMVAPNIYYHERGFNGVESGIESSTAPPSLTTLANNSSTTTTTTTQSKDFVDNTSVYVLYYVWPLWLIIFVSKAIFNSYAFNNRKPWIAIICKRIVMAPFVPVKFADFFIADQITSFTGIFFEIQFYWCVWFAPKTDAVCSAGRSMGLCFLSILPNTWRLLQCFRRFRDQPKAIRKPFPNLINAGKYASSMAEILAWMAYNIAKHTDVFGQVVVVKERGFVDSAECNSFYPGGAPSPTYTADELAAIPASCIIPAVSQYVSGEFSQGLWTAFIMACCVSIFSQIYKFLWDIVVDAGIWVKVTPPPPAVPYWKLREEKVYRDWWPYVAFIVEDFILRSTWAIKLSLSRYVKGVGWMFAVWSLMEVVRRFIWNFFRVENEHVNNTEGYRATKLAPTPAKQISTWDTMADDMTEKFMKEKDKSSAEFPTIRGINLTGVTKFFAQLPEEEKLNILAQTYSTVQMQAMTAATTSVTNIMPPASSSSYSAGFAEAFNGGNGGGGGGGGEASAAQGVAAVPTTAEGDATENSAAVVTSLPSSLPPNDRPMSSPAATGITRPLVTPHMTPTTTAFSPAATSVIMFDGQYGEGKSRFFSELPEEEKVCLVLTYLGNETMNEYLKRIGVISGQGKIVERAAGGPTASSNSFVPAAGGSATARLQSAVVSPPSDSLPTLLSASNSASVNNVAVGLSLPPSRSSVHPIVIVNRGAGGASPAITPRGRASTMAAVPPSSSFPLTGRPPLAGGGGGLATPRSLSPPPPPSNLLLNPTSKAQQQQQQTGGVVTTPSLQSNEGGSSGGSKPNGVAEASVDSSTAV